MLFLANPNKRHLLLSSAGPDIIPYIVQECNINCQYIFVNVMIITTNTYSIGPSTSYVTNTSINASLFLKYPLITLSKYENL